MSLNRLASVQRPVINSIYWTSNRQILSSSLVRFFYQSSSSTLLNVKQKCVPVNIQRQYGDGIDLKKQTFEIDSVEHIRRGAFYKDIDVWSYYKSIHPHIRTMGDTLNHGKSVSNDGPCLGFLQLENKAEPIRWLSYSMVSDQVDRIGSYLWAEKKLIPANSKVAILSLNRPEYSIVEYACLAYGFGVLNLYLSYNSSTVINLLEKTKVDILVVDNIERIESYEKKLFENENIKEIIVMDQMKKDQYGKVRSLASILQQINMTHIRPRPNIDPQTVALYLLTSGTTGEPKIAMLTHDNFVCGLKSTRDREERAGIASTALDRHCSFLPMAHLYEQAVIMLMLSYGCRIIFCPAPDKLLEYYSIFKPTRIFMVPRILNKVYDKVMNEANKSPIKRFLVSLALRQEEPSFFTRFVFRKVKNLFGGEVLSMLSASAPISHDILRFFRIALNIPIYEIYGQTESAGVNTATHLADRTGGTVGTPVCTTEIKLIDVPETNYHSNNNQGEICIRGPCVFKGYYNDEVKTREAIDKNGWLHTGDIGEWTSSGALRLIDRQKHIFKLNQGKYVAPERLEDIYHRSRWVSQIFIDGNSTEAAVVAVVVPDEEYIRHNVPSAKQATFQDICNNEQLKQLILNDLTRLAKENKLKYYETIGNIYLHDQPFSQQNNLLTSTLKIRRVQARQHFQPIIKSLYNNQS